MSSTSTADYPYIRAWNKVVFNSHGAYLQLQLQVAREEGAPHTAIYKRTPSADVPAGWATVEGVTGEGAREDLIKAGYMNADWTIPNKYKEVSK